MTIPRDGELTIREVCAHNRETLGSTTRGPRLVVLHIIQFMLFTIGEEIRKARKHRKISQQALAEDLGMSRATISQIESGTVQEIGVRKLIRRLDYLGL